jgi:transposase
MVGKEAQTMKLSDISRRLPDEIWRTFEPILPPVIWCGNGRPPKPNHSVLHGLLYVLVSGIGWEMVPPCFPSGKTIHRRLNRWLELDCFRTAWQTLAQQYERLRGINWDKVLLDGSKHKAPKGGRLLVPRR